METGYEGLEEIEEIGSPMVPIMDRYGSCYGVKISNDWEENVYKKLNEIIQKVNILIKLKNLEVEREENL